MQKTGFSISIIFHYYCNTKSVQLFKRDTTYKTTSFLDAEKKNSDFDKCYWIVLNILLYLRESSVHPFRGFLGPKNRVLIRIDGALDAHAKSETMISLSVGSL